MSSRMLSSILRNRASIFKTQQSPAIQKVACLGLAQTRFYTANHDDPFNDDADNAPPQHGQLNPKLRHLINWVPFDQKVRYTSDGSEETHPTPDDDLLDAIFNVTTLPYTVGTDICHIPRIHRLLTNQIEHPSYMEPDMPRFWTRVLTPIEARYSGWKSGGYLSLSKSSTFIAGRWAAKEAIIKAFSSAYPALDKIFMHDIVILNSKVQRAISEGRKAASRIAVRNGGPSLPGVGGAAVPSRGAPRAFVRVPAQGVGWIEVSMSISHDEEYATAVALVPVDAKIAEFRPKKSVARGVIAKTYTDERYVR